MNVEHEDEEFVDVESRGSEYDKHASVVKRDTGQVHARTEENNCPEMVNRRRRHSLLSPDTTQQEAEEDHDDNRRRIDEPESTVPTAAQDEVLTPCPVTFDSETKKDEVAVDVPLPEETVEMSGENSQGWITEEAFFTVSPGARQVGQRKEVKMNQLSPAERHEFLKSMEVECYHWKKRHELECAGRILLWTPVGPVP